MRFRSLGLKKRPKSNTSPKTKKNPLKIVLADDDTSFARRFSQFLTERGYETRIVSTISQAKELIEFWLPDAAFVNLMLPESNALSLLRFVHTRSLKRIPKVVVMSTQTIPQGVETMRRAGATEYLVKPFAFEDAIRIIDPEAVKTEEPVEKEKKETPDPGASMIRELHLLNLIIKQATIGGDVQTKLFNLMRMISMKVQALRCSFIRCLDDETGIVLASNDDETVTDLPLQLKYYPEVREVRKNGRPLVITNIRTSDLLAPVKDQLAKTPFETIAVFPVFCRGEFYGVVSVRMEQRNKDEIYYVEKFGQVCSQIISLAIGSSATPA